MAEIPQGLSWVERDTDYALHRREGDQITTFPLSQAEALGLRQKLTDWEAALKQRLQGQSGAVQAVTSFQAQAVTAHADAMNANVLVH